MSKSPLEEKTILLTGGAGSFGQKFVEIALKEHKPKSIRVFDISEIEMVKMKRRFCDDERLRFLIGDVRDHERLKRAMNGVDIVVHTAALKHIDICEYDPIEAKKTNIDGAQNIINAAVDSKVEKVIAISTDKAVHPANLYGATKMVAEKLFIQGNAYSGAGTPHFSCTRYGNVLASSGSVIPLFREQAKKGTLTVTDKRMTRFWITLDEGVNFVIDKIGEMKGGEIFVPKIKSMKITDLAQSIAPKAEIEEIGIRCGEKLDEALITKEESRHTKERDKDFVIMPEYSPWVDNKFKEKYYKEDKPVPENFEYTSGNNKEWLTKDEFKDLLDKLN